MADLDGTPLKRQKTSSDTAVDPEKCVICQTDQNVEPSTTKNGRERVLEAANIREDEVAERLKHIDKESFVYHVNNKCYKTYTHKNKLDAILKSRCTEGNSCKTCTRSSSKSIGQSCRSKIPARDPASQVDVDVYKKSCVVCGNAKHNNDYSNYRICEQDWVDKFLQATLFFLDEVYTRTNDLQDFNSVFGADLYCHKPCIKNYLTKYDRALCSDSNANAGKRMKMVKEMIKRIDPCLKSGRSYSLSDLSNY